MQVGKTLIRLDRGYHTPYLTEILVADDGTNEKPEIWRFGDISLDTLQVLL